MPNPNKFKTREEYNEWYRNYRTKNASKIREYNRKYMKERRKIIGFSAEYRAKKKFPLKERARGILRYAVRSGKIERGRCIDCGSPETQGHHEDYYKPLEVIWLCHLHHAALHKRY